MIMLQNLFRPRVRGRLGEALYERAVRQARDPAFYTTLAVADRIDARFELYTLHVLLLVMRLRDEGDRGAEAGQDLFNTYVSALDHALRELGVGDVSVGKKMRKLGEALYGRMTTWESPLRDGDAAGLAAGLARNVYESEDVATGAALAAYALSSRARLAAQSFDAVVNAPAWAEVAP
ncbi:MAG: ubiquinol-cytochrome C chaperone family protein [Brevundimonas sp.]|uniref:ubiquinol-cytochrome C chaperone family protein n=1 Tax=Brevundimonas sp. TaxID=1871086 RepID=UPI002726181B|nr:ubiquinol-cytochrome C chaperone family protein [Brevundimonas sp.]MDO9587108.1 ubiquinol-cytochrome C chaperone family protein [Brevundimonas sp.]MDP3370455.1 ubiquinol-cytochrome C chaperone family protein [Brevundimonas sp.]MDP3656348.1 ubiquinol-cytochrome C chaperone family protein [Brevundimonas sp.]MDZ4113296.1 ubiquinol-cytochrome C chaperone family protein [Brevundimonas sp.]